MPPLSEPSFLKDFVHFESHVAELFQTEGWTVEIVNQVSYDLIVTKDNQIGAVQVKWLKSPVQKPQLSKFVDFLETQAGRKFNCGFFITTQGYGGSARALIRTWGDNPKLLCGIAAQNEIIWINDNPDVPPPTPPKPDKIYFGVFTCKGGVGKTTITAHLAGAFVLQGFNVALVDLDPERNLHKLIGDGVYLPKPQNVGESIEVYDKDTWDEDAARDCKIVICDCSPAFERNPEDLVKKFDYCIIPTTFNPLGINKHGQVIKDTVKDIRKINKHAHLFVLVNNFRQTTNRQMKILKNVFFEAYEELKETDDKFHYIDPEEVCIRSSDQLYYWGIHCLENPENPRSELAFKLIGGKCKPREDFIDLAYYIETKAGLGILRNES
ncbi:MAG TPA: restriction endonuclease [Cyanobacteria bacterium UBA8803]|nr:restriction endonuclease [Cyanobacteria bacterium UBA9273]HBL62678.1 restriction endonuclease [Cyanobacteria bacterium UBA8803]